MALIHGFILNTHYPPQIEKSPLQNIPNLLCHILDSKIDEYKASAIEVKSPPGMHLILNSPLCASQPTVVKWAISITTDIVKQEIVWASNAETGLNFNALHACSANLVGFDLKEIVDQVQKCCSIDVESYPDTAGSQQSPSMLQKEGS